jgi:hypothetical protein
MGGSSFATFAVRSNVWLVDTWNRGATVNAAYAQAVADRLYAPSDQQGMDIEAEEVVLDANSDTVRLSGESVGKLRGPTGGEMRYRNAVIRFQAAKPAVAVTADAIEMRPERRSETPAAATEILQLKHVTSRHIKAAFCRTSEPAFHKHPVNLKALKQGNQVVLEGDEAHVHAVKEFVAALDDPRPDPLPPDEVLRDYLEAWLVPYDDAEGVEYPDYETMYSLTTKAGQAQISFAEFRATVQRWGAIRAGSGRATGLTWTLAEIVTIYEPQIEGDRAYVSYTLREGPLTRTEPAPPDWIGSYGEYGGGGLGSRGGYGGYGGYGGGGVGGPQEQPKLSQGQAPRSGKTSATASTVIPASSHSLAAGSVWPAQFGDSGGGGFGDSGAAYHIGGLERNQAVLVKEDDQWRLPMRFDVDQRRWYLPLSGDPLYAHPWALTPSGRTEVMVSPAVRVEGGMIRFATGPDGRSVVSASLEDADVREALQAIADQAGVRLVMPEELQGKLTAKIDDVTSDIAIRMIAGAVGATVSVRGETYTLGPAEARAIGGSRSFGTKTKRQPGDGAVMNMDLKDCALREVLGLIGDALGARIEVADGVDLDQAIPRVQLRSLTQEQAIAAVGDACNLECEVREGVYYLRNKAR